VGVDIVELPLQADVQGLQGQQDVERHFRERRPDLHPPDEGRAPAAMHLQPGKRDVPAERIRDEIDRVAEVGQRANPMVFAERRAPGFKERFGAIIRMRMGRSGP